MNRIQSASITHSIDCSPLAISIQPLTKLESVSTSTSCWRLARSHSRMCRKWIAATAPKARSILDKHLGRARSRSMLNNNDDNKSYLVGRRAHAKMLTRTDARLTCLTVVLCGHLLDLSIGGFVCD